MDFSHRPTFTLQKSNSGQGNHQDPGPRPGHPFARCTTLHNMQRVAPRHRWATHVSDAEGRGSGSDSSDAHAPDWDPGQLPAGRWWGCEVGGRNALRSRLCGNREDGLFYQPQLQLLPLSSSNALANAIHITPSNSHLGFQERKKR